MQDYEKTLSEIRSFVHCPKLLDPLDNDEKSDLEDAELAKQLDTRLVDVLVSTSSICDSESLISEFSCSEEDEEDDDLDRIVERLQNPSGHNERSINSMPTISSLFNLPSSNTSINTFKPSNKLKNKDKAKLKKIKFTQHQSKINYSFPNESSIRLFDKIVHYNHKFKRETSIAENPVENQKSQDNKEINDNDLKISSQENQEKQINQENQTNQENQENRMDEISQENQVNQKIQENQVNQENQENQVNQESQENQENQMNQDDQENQTSQKKVDQLDLIERTIEEVIEKTIEESIEEEEEIDIINEPNCKTTSISNNLKNKNVQIKPAANKSTVKELANEIRKRSKFRKLNNLKRPKSEEIFTLKSNKTSALDNLFASIRSK